MAYDEQLAERIRTTLGDRDDLSERKMFGGLAFLLGGHMSVVADSKYGLMVRCDPAEADDLCDAPGVEPMEMRGRPMKGWLRVDADQLHDDEHLAEWVDVGVEFASALPPKSS